MATVPVIDISGLRSTDTAARRAVASEIGAACETIGFLTVVGHGVSQTVVAEAFTQTRRVFELPMDVKMASAWDDDHVNRGYDPPGNQRLDGDSAPDNKEAWAFSPSGLIGSSPMQGENVWPDLRGFRAPIEAYHGAAMALCERLLRAMALSLDLAEDYFEPFHRHPVCTLRVHHYPPRPATAGNAEFGAGAHTDWGALTVLAQDDSGSLEVRAKDGEWIEVPPVADSFVINIGDLLQRWTNDRYVSTMHRVLGVPGVDRHSIACFFDLDHEAMIECIPTCIESGVGPKYGPVTAGAHLMERYEASLAT
ncbi:MAG: 2-oxoglutarate and iron-dependent oxygenase domain-containing protein [Actinomycetota bacterium]